jgi:hypothetical protein
MYAIKDFVIVFNRIHLEVKMKSPRKDKLPRRLSLLVPREAEPLPMLAHKVPRQMANKLRKKTSKRLFLSLRLNPVKILQMETPLRTRKRSLLLHPKVEMSKQQSKRKPQSRVLSLKQIAMKRAATNLKTRLRFNLNNKKRALIVQVKERNLLQPKLRNQ